MTESKDQVRAFVESNFLMSSSQRLNDDDSLLDLGIVDSTGFLELIHFVETTFGIRVPEKEMVFENFETIDNIAQFVDRKRANSPVNDA